MNDGDTWLRISTSLVTASESTNYLFVTRLVSSRPFVLSNVYKELVDKDLIRLHLDTEDAVVCSKLKAFCKKSK